eukprot:Rmarinus@m.1200
MILILPFLYFHDVSFIENSVTLRGHQHVVHTAVFSADGKYLVSTSKDTTLRVWSVEEGTCCCTLEGHTDEVLSAALSPSGEIVVSSSSDKTIRIWDRETGECRNVLTGHSQSVEVAIYVPRTDSIVSASSDRTLRLWDSKTGTCTAQFLGHTGWVFTVVLSPNGKTVCSASEDKTLRLWDVTATDGSPKVLQGHTDEVWSVVFSPDGNWVLSGSGDMTLKLWNADTGHCFRTLQGHYGFVWSAGFVADGTMIVSGSDDYTLRVWDVSTGKCQHILKGHSLQVRAVVVADDGRTVLSASSDGTVRVWDCYTGACLAILKGHTDEVWSVVLSPVERCVASCSSDACIKLWNFHSVLANVPHYFSATRDRRLSCRSDDTIDIRSPPLSPRSELAPSSDILRRQQKTSASPELESPVNKPLSHHVENRIHSNISRPNSPRHTPSNRKDDRTSPPPLDMRSDDARLPQSDRTSPLFRSDMISVALSPKIHSPKASTRAFGEGSMKGFSDSPKTLASASGPSLDGDGPVRWSALSKLGETVNLMKQCSEGLRRTSETKPIRFAQSMDLLRRYKELKEPSKSQDRARVTLKALVKRNTPFTLRSLLQTNNSKALEEFQRSGQVSAATIKHRDELIQRAIEKTSTSLNNSQSALKALQKDRQSLSSLRLPYVEPSNTEKLEELESPSEKDLENALQEFDAQSDHLAAVIRGQAEINALVGVLAAKIHDQEELLANSPINNAIVSSLVEDFAGKLGHFFARMMTDMEEQYRIMQLDLRNLSMFWDEMEGLQMERVRCDGLLRQVHDLDAKLFEQDERLADIKSALEKMEKRLQRGLCQSSDLERLHIRFATEQKEKNEVVSQLHIVLREIMKAARHGFMEPLQDEVVYRSVTEMPDAFSFDPFVSENVIQNAALHRRMARRRSGGIEERGLMGVDQGLFLRERKFEDYIVVEELAPGRVYHVLHGSDDYVIKAFPASMQRAFEREIRALSRLTHPSIIKICGYFVEKQRLLIQYPFYSNGTLEDFMRKESQLEVEPDKEHQRFQRNLDICRALLNTVVYLHDNHVTHRDLKPSNILLDQNFRPVITDFEIAKDHSPEGQLHFATTTTMNTAGIPGTPGYIAPEVLSGGVFSPKSDMYAVGVIMLRMFMGVDVDVTALRYNQTSRLVELPRTHKNPDLVALIQSCLREDPVTRCSAHEAVQHRVFSVVPYLERGGFLLSSQRKLRGLSAALEDLRVQYVPVSFEDSMPVKSVELPRQAVFEVLSAQVADWPVEVLLGDWTVSFEGEDGLDRMGLQHDILAEFFDQFENKSGLVEGTEGGSAYHLASPTTLNISLAEYTTRLRSVGCMMLRALITEGAVPVSFNECVYEAAFGRLHPIIAHPDGPDVKTLLGQGGDWVLSQLEAFFRYIELSDPYSVSLRYLLCETIPIAEMQEMFSYLDLEDVTRDNSKAQLLSHLISKLLGSNRLAGCKALGEGMNAVPELREHWHNMNAEEAIMAIEGNRHLDPEVFLGFVEYHNRNLVDGTEFERMRRSCEQCIRKMDSNTLHRLLRFVTGTARMPRNSFQKKLKFLFIRGINPKRLPTAHTCFDRIDFPVYSTEAELEEKLLQAIREPPQFGYV